MSEGRVVKILLVEDDEIDVESVRRSFERNRIANTIYVAKDGVEGLEMLRGTGAQRLDRPLIILLDINMPRMNGLEFLREVRADKELRDLVVFVLTTSSNENDIFEAYNLNVAGYMLKTEVGNGFAEAIRLIDHYWRVVELRN
ncbi:MAG: response regulator [Gammaproteobacteria bacterium]